MVKKTLSIIIILIIVLPVMILNANAAQNSLDGQSVVVYENTMTEEEQIADSRQQIIDQLEAQELDISEFAVSFGVDEDIMPLNDPDDYKHVSGTSKTVPVTGDAGNQPSGGTRFETGGAFFYVDSKGPEVTVSINLVFPTGKGYSFPLSVTLGIVGPSSGGVAGYIVNVPETQGFYKCQVTKTYRVTPYVIYHRSFDEPTWSYVWNEWSSGTTVVHISTSLKAVRVS